jgi:RNA polymerase primary sigma factor
MAEPHDTQTDGVEPFPASGKDTTLLKYFREITAYPLLTDDEEQRATRRIVDLEVEEWTACLSYLPAAAHALPLLRASFEELSPRMRFIMRAHSRFRRTRGKLSSGQSRRYAQSVRVLAHHLRRADQDREVLDALERWFMAGGRNGLNGSFRGLPALRTTEGLRRAQESLCSVSRRSVRERNHFVASNLRLVISIAKRARRGTMPLDDLIQEGNLGLIKAVQRFDPERGFRFSTYASWWIRHAISRALADRSRTVRLPVHLVEAHKRIERIRRTAGMRGREPTEPELARELGVSIKRLRKILRHGLEPAFSLDRQISDENPYTYLELVTDDAPTPLDQVSDRDFGMALGELLSSIPPVEAQVVRWRYGIGSTEHTLRQIGTHYKLSRERIRQIQKQAIVRIRENVKGLY